MTTEKKALIICAHDDDEVIAAGGTIVKLANAGYEVTTLIFATGNEGFVKQNDKDSIIQTRIEERRNAQQWLGTKDYITHSFNDFSDLSTEFVYKSIIKAVRQVRPELVFSHLETDYLAHRTLAQIVGEAVWQAGWQCSADLGSPWQVNKLYLFSVLDLISKPSHIIDITETFEQKISAMKAYASQVDVVPAILEQLETKARVYGSMAGFKYGEAFIKSRHIPIKVNNVNEL